MLNGPLFAITCGSNPVKPQRTPKQGIALQWPQQRAVCRKRGLKDGRQHSSNQCPPSSWKRSAKAAVLIERALLTIFEVFTHIFMAVCHKNGVWLISGCVSCGHEGPPPSRPWVRI